tara:strand:+ start:26193 stop:26537 length:345 start_codon:yes stop_codon:yes gene_type:complete
MNTLTSANQLQTVAFIFLVVAVKLYVDHRRNDYSGGHLVDGSYPSLTPLKHDMMKQMTLDMFVFLVYGLGSGERFFDSNDFLGSKLGSMLVNVAGYLVYYELVEPYVASPLPKF